MPPVGPVGSVTWPPLPAAMAVACTLALLLRLSCESADSRIWPPGPAPKLSALILALLTVSAPALTRTPPPLPFWRVSLISSVLLPLIATGANLLTVRPVGLAGSAGTSPIPATPVAHIVPAGAERLAAWFVVLPAVVTELLVIVSGPPTGPISLPCGAVKAQPWTIFLPGVSLRKPTTAGG